MAIIRRLEVLVDNHWEGAGGVCNEEVEDIWAALASPSEAIFTEIAQGTYASQIKFAFTELGWEKFGDEALFLLEWHGLVCRVLELESDDGLVYSDVDQVVLRRPMWKIVPDPNDGGLLELQ